jgi:hypothetical protein
MDQAAANHLADQIGDAASDLSDWHLKKAAAEERQIRDELRDLAKLVAGPRDTDARLKDALEKVDSAIQQQQQVADQTKSANFSDPSNPPQATTDQRKLIDKTDRARQDIADIAPAAADAIKNADAAMQQAWHNMDQNHPDQAGSQQQAALDQLQNAHTALTDQIAQAAQEPPAPADAPGNLAALQKKAEDLEKQEQNEIAKAAAATQPSDQKAAAAQQATLRQQAQDIQQQAAETSKDAAAAMAQAADQMDKAAAELNPQKATDPAAAAANEQQAVSDIDKAAQNLADDAQHLAQEQDQAAAIEKQLDHLGDIIEAQQAVDQATAMPGAAADQLGGDQGKVADATKALNDQQPPDDAQTRAPLADAKQNMDAAAGALHQADPKSALPPEKDALSDLYKAQQSLQEKLGDLKQDLGQPPDDGSGQPELSKQLDAAQQDLAKAQSELGGDEAKGQSAQASQDLAGAAKKVGQIAAKPNGVPSAAQQSIQAAQQALSDAAAQPEPADASALAAQAQADLSQAQGAMSMVPAASPGQLDENQPGGGGVRTPGGKGAQDGGPRQAPANSTAAFVGLPPRDRQALQQSASDKYPQAYGQMVEQYRRNLSDGDR